MGCHLSAHLPRRGSADSVLSWCIGGMSDTPLDNDWGLNLVSRQSRDLTMDGKKLDIRQPQLPYNKKKDIIGVEPPNFFICFSDLHLQLTTNPQPWGEALANLTLPLFRQGVPLQRNWSRKWLVMKIKMTLHNLSLFWLDFVMHLIYVV